MEFTATTAWAPRRRRRRETSIGGENQTVSLLYGTLVPCRVVGRCGALDGSCLVEDGSTLASRVVLQAACRRQPSCIPHCLRRVRPVMKTSKIMSVALWVVAKSVPIDAVEPRVLSAAKFSAHGGQRPRFVPRGEQTFAEDVFPTANTTTRGCTCARE
ncbi:hypothetical protein MRX96_040687 [Rhipicephalus microplus]